MLNKKNLLVKAGLSLGAAMAIAGSASAQEAEAAAETQAASEPGAAVEAEAATEAEATVEADAVVASTIAETLRSSTQYSTLVAGMEATGMIDRLAGPGPFTVFAPTDTAFSQAMSAADIEALMGEAARPMLEGMMGYYVVPGEHDIASLMERAEANGGSLTLPTVAGAALTLSVEGTGAQRAVKLTGDIGVAYVSDFDLEQSNGLVHVINGIVIPNTQPPQAAAESANGGSADSE